MVKYSSCPILRVSFDLMFQVVKPHWVSGVSKVLRLTRLQEVTLCIYLLQETSPEVRNQATTLLKAKLPDLIRAYIDTSEYSAS